MPPALLVLPDAINRWGGSQFVDSEATGRYQSYLADEVVPFVDAHYRTLPVREGARGRRARAAAASARCGSASIGPEVFGAIGSHAGDCAFETSILPELRDAAIAYDRAGGYRAFIERFAQDRTRVSFTGVDDCWRMRRRTRPNRALGLPFCELPIDVRSGELREAVWQRFLAHDPLERIAREPHALAQRDARVPRCGQPRRARAVLRRTAHGRAAVARAACASNTRSSTAAIAAPAIVTRVRLAAADCRLRSATAADAASHQWRHSRRAGLCYQRPCSSRAVWRA